MGANELSLQLWREREMLEMLLFKLEEQELLLAAGRSRWVQHASREIEQVIERLRAAGISRAVEADAVAAEWGAGDDATIRDLLAHAPGSWRGVFTDHLRALGELTAEIGRMRDANSDQLRAAMRATQETIAGLGDASGEYTTRGEQVRDDSARIIDTES